MAALRISVPGQPTELVDLGPGVGRTTHTRGKVYGGVLVVAQTPSKPKSKVEDAKDARRAAALRWYYRNREERLAAMRERYRARKAER